MKTIYVRLKNEGVEAFAPAPTRSLGANVFEILTPADYNPSAEEWEFAPGTVVECEERTVGARRQLIAVRRVPSSGRRRRAFMNKIIVGCIGRPHKFTEGEISKYSENQYRSRQKDKKITDHLGRCPACAAFMGDMSLIDGIAASIKDEVRTFVAR